MIGLVVVNIRTTLNVAHGKALVTLSYDNMSLPVTWPFRRLS